jgi:hypothetical protein
MSNNIAEVATQIASTLGGMVNEDQISPPDVVIGATRGAIAFWMGCVQEGSRVEALNALRQGLNEEIDNMIRGIANGMVPA